MRRLGIALVGLSVVASILSGPSGSSVVPSAPLQHAIAAVRTARILSPITRWVSVGVSTLWVSSGATRSVDRLTTSPPAAVRQWIAAMTVSQKRWLVGKVETQVLYGTTVAVITTIAGWTRVVVASQPTLRDTRGYPGWIPTWQLSSHHPTSTSETAVVSSPSTWLFKTVSLAPSSNQVMEVSYGTQLPVVKVNPNSVVVVLLDGRKVYVPRSAVSLRATRSAMKPSHQQVIIEASKFLGLSYLWGGTSGFAFDCSGFTYSVFRFLGVTIPRDAAPQATKGEPVSRRNLRAGDLVFFRNASGAIVHVAIFIGSPGGVPSVIHSPDTGLTIMITPLSAWTNASFAGARRYIQR